MTQGRWIVLLLLFPFCFSRTCVWTGSVCDCTVDCAALCTGPGSCNRLNCLSVSSQCCQCDSTYFADGLVCNLCGTSCPWASGAPGCSCSCDAGCEKCSGTASSCVLPTCHSSCKTCSSFTVCLSCYPNAHLAIPSCECNSGYFGSNARYCEPCASVCLTCASTADQCTSCQPNAVLTSSNTCVCPLGFSIDSTNCVPCDTKCASCLSPGTTQCLSCLPSFKLEGISPAACVCSEGMYLDATTGLVCKACDRTCATCMGMTANNCLSCFAGAGLKSLAPSSCICFPPYEKKLDSSKCLNCHKTCLTCLDETSQSCSSCQSHAEIVSGLVGPCQCSTGFYPSPDASSCRVCSVTCWTCSGLEDFQCLSCKQYAGLMNGRCVCNSSFYGNPHAGNCQPCPSICSSCIGLQAVCVSIIPTPSLSVLDNNSLKLSFDSPLRSNLTTPDIRVEVRSMAEDLVYALWSVSVLVPVLSFQIDLEIGSLLSENTANVQIYFSKPDSIISVAGMPINIVPLQAELQGLFNLSTRPFHLNRDSSSAQISHYASQATLASALVSSLLTGKFGGLWSLVNQLQLLTYIPMLAIDLPVNLAEMLAAINVNSVFSNPLDYFPQPNNSTGCADLPDFALRYGLKSPIFFTNAGIMFAAAFSCAAAFIPIYIVSKLRLQWISNYCKRKLSFFKWGVFIRYWLQSCMDIGLFALLQVTTMSFCLNYPAYLASIAAAVLVLPLFVLGPLLLLVFAIQNKEKFTLHSDPGFNSLWGALFLDLKPSPSFAIACFPLLFLTHRVLFSFCILFLQDFPLLQGSFVCIFQLTVSCTQALTHMLSTRPFKDALDSFSNSIVELASSLVFLSCSLFVLDVSSQFATAAEWIGVVALMGSLAISTLVSLIRLSILAVHMIIEFRRALRAGNIGIVLSQVHPLTAAQSKE